MPEDYRGLFRAARSPGVATRTGPGAATRQGSDYRSLFRSARKATVPSPEPEDGFSLPAAGRAALDTLGFVASLPKLGADQLARKTARAFDIPVDDDATTGQMLRDAIGLTPGAESEFVGLPGFGTRNLTNPFAQRLLGKGVEFTGDTATDPSLPLSFGSGAAGRVASGALALTMGRGALEEGAGAIEAFQDEGLTPETAERGLGALLGAGGTILAGRGALARRPRPAGMDEAFPEAPRLDRTSADPNLNPDLMELRRRFEMEKAQEAATQPSEGIPDPQQPMELDGALASAADDVRFERIRQQMAAETFQPLEFHPDRTQPVDLRSFASEIPPPTPDQLTREGYSPEEAQIAALEFEAARGVDDVLARRSPVVEATAPEPAQVGAIAGDQTVSPNPVDLSPEAAAIEPTFNPDVTQPVFNPDVTQPIPKLPEPGNVKPATIFQPETRKPEGVPADKVDLVARQAELLKAAGLEDFPLVPDPARKMIFDGDGALQRLRSRGQAVASDLGSVAGEGVGAIRDLAVYGASLLERGVRSFPDWSRQITEALGGTVKNIGEHLQRAWETAQALWEKTKASNSEVGAVGSDITPLVQAEQARKIAPIPDRAKVAPEQAAEVPKVTDAEIDFDTARQFTDEDFAQKVESGKLSTGEKKALDERLYQRMVARDDAVKALNEARANNGDVGTANANLLQASLDYVTSFGLFTKDEMAARRAMTAAAKVRESGPQTPDKFLTKVFKEIPGVSNSQAATLLDVFERRPDALPDALRAAVKPGAWRKFTEFWKAGLLSGPSTHVANLVGNTIEQGIRAVETAVASGIDLAIPGKRERFTGEVGAELVGAANGFGPAFKAAMNELVSAATLKPETADISAGKLDSRVGAIGGKAGRAVRVPFRLLGAADELFKGMFGEAELYKLAYRKAARELGGKGDVKARTAQIIKEARSDSGQHVDLIQQVGQSKLERTFQQEPGAMAQGLMRLVNSRPYLQVVLPFLKTPANITRATIGRSPVGFVDAFKKAYDHRNGRATRGEVVDAFARPLVGTAIMAGFGALAQQGLMTGGDPNGEKQRTLPGWQPYSLVLRGQDGSRTYVPYSRFQPVSNLLGFVADMSEASGSDEKKNLFERGLSAAKDNVLDDSFLKGLSNAIEAISDSDRFLPSYLANLGASVVPNIVAKAASALDPVMRDTSPESKGIAGTPERLLKTVQSRIPGLSDDLPAKKTGLGEDRVRPGSAFSRFALPVQASTEKPGSDLERLLVDLDVSRSAPGREVTIPNSNGKKIRLTDEEYEKLTEADRRAAAILRRTMNRSGFRRLDSEAKKEHVERVFARERNLEKKRLWNDRGLRRRASQVVREART